MYKQDNSSCKSQCSTCSLKYTIYHSVLHIRPPFCDLSAGRKRRGGLICGIWHFISRIRPLFRTLHVWRKTGLGTRLSACFSSSRNSMVKIDWQRLATAYRAAFSKHSAGLSFQCAIALTPLADTLAMVGAGLWTLASFWRCHSTTDSDLDLDSFRQKLFW